MAFLLHRPRAVSVEQFKTIDGNEAAASAAFRLSEVIAIYPITPASPMGELSDAWAAAGRKNIWGAVPSICEMQSEGGAAGAVHGALQAGALATTFTASQGLLLMIPNMYKIAGELTPAVIHVAARTVATHALSIFGDHSDVMAARATGFGLLASASVQEAHDLAVIAHVATLESRIPFVHFFDGFRTSHEIAKIKPLGDDDLANLVPHTRVLEHRHRALDPDAPVLRGTAQNPDVFFQAREAVNPFYNATPDIVAAAMDKFFDVAGRRYNPFDYEGHPDAERVLVIMGSGAETAAATVLRDAARGDKVGVVKVRLYRPFDVDRFVATLPATTKQLIVLDRTKEPGAPGEPLYLDVLAAAAQGCTDRTAPRIIGGRYGLSSKEFTPGMVRAALGAEKHGFTIGIYDDVTHTSLNWSDDETAEPEGAYSAVLYGLGSDGTVGASKNAIKIIGEHTDHTAQGYFVYDSKKAGATTISHLRFGEQPIRAPYLVKSADYVACHNPVFLDRYDILADSKPGGVFVINSPFSAKAAWDSLPATYQRHIIEKKLRAYTIDASRVAREAGLGGRINTVMQACFFHLSSVLPSDQAIRAMKDSIEKSYGKKGRVLVDRNFAAVDGAIAHLEPMVVPDAPDAASDIRFPIPDHAPEFVKRITGRIIAGQGDLLPVSAFAPDGTFPTATAQWEKRNIAAEIPVWDPDVCIQCNKCALVCPHATIRVKVAPEAPEGLPSVPYKGKDLGDGLQYMLQVAPEDCTGCQVCVEVCPAKNKSEVKKKAINMTPKDQVLEVEKKRWDLFLSVEPLARDKPKLETVKGSQFLEPLFEFSGACAGCGETPYIKLLTQLFGERMIVANATGCSSIYGGNLPSTPYTKSAEGRGPAWSNSLFEDNAEFGLGMRLAVDAQRGFANELLRRLSGEIGDNLVEPLLGADPSDEAGYAIRREQIAALAQKLATMDGTEASALAAVARTFVPRSVWIVGGDGWAYDIGYGGLDHAMASGKNVNIIVLDTEVYSNTGGQMSKATPKGAVAKFAAAGKSTPKKDLALMAMSYRNVYVAQIAMGGGDKQTVQAIVEADSYDGPSIVIAYSHCIAHGINMAKGMDQQRLAVQSGYWPLLRYDPRNSPPLTLDSRAPKMGLSEYIKGEGRYRVLEHSAPDVARRLQAEAQQELQTRFALYQHLAAQTEEMA